MADSLSLAFLVLLESLSPEQRAVFLLREVFDYPYEQIAQIVGKSEPNVRQLAVRARRHVEERRTRFDASREQREQLADRFFARRARGRPRGARGAARRGRGAARRRRRQGAGARAGAVRPRPRGAHAAQLGARGAAAWAASTLRRVEVNGQPGAMLLDAEGQVIGVMALDIADGRVQGIRSIVNPDKLGHLGRVADVGALRRDWRGISVRGPRRRELPAVTARRCRARSRSARPSRFRARPA